MKIKMEPIGFVKTEAKTITQCWKTSDVEGDLVDVMDQTLILDIKPDACPWNCIPNDGR